MREAIELKEGWKFHLGEIEIPDSVSKAVTYLQAKTERDKTGPAGLYFPDESENFGTKEQLTAILWDKVTLPHDYIISQIPNKEENGSLGFFHYQNAWYRYHFRGDEKDRGKRITVYFEAVAVCCTVYLNGCLIQRNFSGYNSFEVDITDYIRFKEDNVLAVHVDAVSQHEGWWYEGAGIYRPVWMVKTEKIAVDRYGVYVHPEKGQGENWNIPVEVMVRNDFDSEKEVNVKITIVSPAGRKILQTEKSITIGEREKETADFDVKIRNPELWNTDHPSQYCIITEVYSAKKLLDQVTDRFGFRTIHFNPDKGFFLNGKHVFLKGVNSHIDYGLTGKAVPDRAVRYKLELIKEMGANAFRTCHYPHSNAEMDMLDEMGFLVIDETRWFESTPESLKQLDMLVKRDRNRPGVILWSIGNEEPYIETDMGKRIIDHMIAEVHKLDRTRKITTAVCHNPAKATAVSNAEVLGVNYHLYDLDRIHQRHPKIPVYLAECCATGTTRGWYLPDDPKRGFISAFDHDVNKDFVSRESTWKEIMKRPWICGAFQWDAVEHRGEAQWPRLCSAAGALDLYLQKKDAFFQNQSHWTKKPMVHILPHWNLKEMSGETVRVVTYTNCEEVSLFLNGKIIGNKKIEKYGHGEWMIPYIPGVLTAVGYIGNKKAAEDSEETSGVPSRLKLTLNTGAKTADSRDVVIATCTAEDSKGREVKNAAPMIDFTTNGLGTILGTGSDITDSVPPDYPRRKMRAGLCSVIVKTGNKPGILRIYASSTGLEPASLAIKLDLQKENGGRNEL